MDISLLYQLYLDSDGVTTDSRNPVANKIFFALHGPNFDGSAFVSQVLSDGAHSVVTSNIEWQNEKRIILVDDVLDTLQKLATYHRRTLSIPVFAITGSNGKTTTKELIHNVLSEKFNVIATRGNFNNLLGLPLTILRARTEHELMVLEMGSNAFGEIAKLCAIAEPDYGLITNIGAAHLQGFDNLNGVRKEKTSLYKAVADREGTLFIPSASPVLVDSAETMTNKVYYEIGSRANTDRNSVQIQLTQIVPEISGFFEDKDEQFGFRSHLMGEHNAQNCGAAIAVGLHFDIPPARIAQALAKYLPSNNRSQIIKSKNLTIILDAYNANPVSMTKALDTLDLWPSLNKIAILGDMKELGAQSDEAHKRMIQRVEESRYQQVYFVGNEFAKHVSGAFSDVNELADKINVNLEESDPVVILIKGSRSMHLERILPYLSINLEQI